MSADVSYTTGELDVSSYSWSSASSTSITTNWWQKYGRIVEFQLVFTTGSRISAGNKFAAGLPRPAQAGAFVCLGQNSNVQVEYKGGGDTEHGALQAVQGFSLLTEYIVHGIYISES